MDWVVLRYFCKQISEKNCPLLSKFPRLKGQDLKEELTHRPGLNMMNHFLHSILSEQKLHHLKSIEMYLVSFFIEKSR
jgi:hypothetical protein